MFDVVWKTFLQSDRPDERRFRRKRGIRRIRAIYSSVATLDCLKLYLSIYTRGNYRTWSNGAKLGFAGGHHSLNVIRTYLGSLAGLCLVSFGLSADI